MSLLAFRVPPLCTFFTQSITVKKENLLIKQRLLENILQENAISVFLLQNVMFNLMCYLY